MMAMSKLGDDLAADFALRVLDGDVERDARGLLESDPSFRAAVQAWEDRLAGLAMARAVPEAPPADLFARIEAEIGLADQGLENAVTLRADEGEWTVLAQGVECKLLWQPRQGGRRTVLVRMAPGASYAPHHHDEDEECFVVSGELSFAGHQLRAGDFHVALAGSDHPLASTREGCVILINAA